MKELIGFFLMQIVDKGESALVAILGCSVPRYVLFGEYNRLGLQIEDLGKDEKQQMWEFIHQHFPDRTKEFRIDSCKIIHLVSHLIQK